MRYSHLAPRDDEQPSGVRAKYVTTGSQPLVQEGEVIVMARVERKRSQVRLDGDRSAASLLDAFMRRRGISNAELAELLEVSETVVRKMRECKDSPVHLGDVLALLKKAPRHGRAFIAMLEEGHG